MASAQDSKQVDFKARLYERYLTGHAHRSTETIQESIGHRITFLRQVVCSRLPLLKTSHILDLGCGHGAILFAAQQAGYTNLTGVDVSPEQIDAARQLGLADVHCEDANTYLSKMPDGAFDAVIAFDILEHFTRPELFSLTDELHRVLTKGGRLILHVPNAEAIFSGTIRYGDLTHELAFTTESLNQLASACRFKLVEVAEDLPAVHGLKSLLRNIIWRVGTLGFRLLAVAENGVGFQTKPLSQNMLAVLEAV